MQFTQLASFDNYIPANMQLSLLKEEGIRCYIKDEYTITLDPLLSPAIGGMKLMVSEADLARALAIIKEADQKFVETFPCPHCGQCRLERVRQVTYPAGWWQKIRLLLINGQASAEKVFFHCHNCGADLDALPAG